MTTCLDCGFNHVMNVFVVDWTGEDGWTAVFECPNCGSDNCVSDADAKSEGHDPEPISNAFEFIGAISGSKDDTDSDRGDVNDG